MAKDTINFSLGPGERDAVVADLRDIFIGGSLQGVDFRPLRRGNQRTRSGESRSRLITWGLHVAALACRKELVPPAPALPETTGTTDADRLIRARGSMTRAECARAAGLKDESSVRNVESPTRGMKLAGRLLAFVESIEAEQ